MTVINPVVAEVASATKWFSLSFTDIALIFEVVLLFGGLMTPLTWNSNVLDEVGTLAAMLLPERVHRTVEGLHEKLLPIGLILSSAGRVK